MNNTSPGGSVRSPESGSQDAVGDIAGSVSAIRINRSRDVERSSASETDQPAPRLKLTPNDFEWGDALGEGSYSRVGSAAEFVHSLLDTSFQGWVQYELVTCDMHHLFTEPCNTLIV